MTCLDNYRTHYCPDSAFSLVSENDAEFEVCTCFRNAMAEMPGLAESETRMTRSSTMAAEQLWYRTIAALAKVCGTGKAVQTEPVTAHKHEEVLVAVRKR
ncbi:MAG: hypothetical protein ACJ74Z_13010 [Bryobacteraceae bacterium]|jgi:hypothetical protein